MDSNSADSAVWTPEDLNALLQGRYQLVRELGKGGAGTVYLARDLKLKRLVALKTVTDASAISPGMMQRFRYESRALATVQHPNIVQIYEVLELQGRPVFVMEYVDGVPLHRASVMSGVDSVHGALPKEAPDFLVLAKVFAAIAKGLAHAHSHEMIHRDIKPANILLTSDNIPKILDFGIAKLSVDAVTQTADTQRTRVGELLGTPSFMSPEQALADPDMLTESTDVYSLGATLYYCLTRKPPHRGRTVMEIIKRLASEPVELPTLIDPTIPRDLEAICLKALEKHPSKRYASATAFAEDLENFRNHRPVLARPYDFREKLIRAVVRRKELFVASVILILLMFSGLLASQAVQYQVAKESLVDGLRERLEGIAATAALTINPADVQQIHTPADRESPVFVHIVQTLERIKQQNPNVVFVYLMRESTKSPGKLEFIAENDMLYSLEQQDDDGNGVLEGLEIPADVGDVYEETEEFPAMKVGLRQTTSDPDTSLIDEYGVSLSGYSPIRNSEGAGIAVLGVDITNDEVVRAFREIRRAFVWGVAFSTLLSLALLGFVANWIVGLWMRPGG